MNARGHNERSFRLDTLAAEARNGLAKVEQGEEFTIGGWLAYGHALNEGRALFPGDREFGQWIEQNVHSQLAKAPGHDDRLAAMWAAANADQFEEARQRGNPRTSRGIHAKWKEIEAEREAARVEAERQEREAQSRAEQESGTTPDGQENKGDEPKEAAEADDFGTAQLKPDQETPSDTQAAPEGQPAPSQADAPQGSDGAGEQDQSQTGAEPEPDPYAQMQKGLDKFTREGLEGELIEERIAHCETKEKLKAEKAKRKKAEAREKELSTLLADMTTTDDQEVIRRQSEEIGRYRRRMEQANQALTAERKRSYALNKRVEEHESELEKLRAERENQEFTI